MANTASTRAIRMNARRGGNAPGRYGCGFLIATCVFSCCFLVLDAALVTVLYNSLAPLAPEVLRRPKTAQLVLFVGPVLLLAAQWWLVDLLVDRLSPDRRRGK